MTHHKVGRFLGLVGRFRDSFFGHYEKIWEIFGLQGELLDLFRIQGGGFVKEKKFRGGVETTVGDMLFDI